MDTKKTIKQVVSFAVSIGVGMIIGNGVNATTPATINAISKVLVYVGKVALSNMVADKASNYAEQEVDKLIDMVSGVKFGTH